MKHGVTISEGSATRLVSGCTLTKRAISAENAQSKEGLGYFKVTLGTGIRGPAPCHRPYCGHTGDPDTFFTREQIDYMHSILLRKATDALVKDLKSLEFEHKPRGFFRIDISIRKAKRE